MRYDPFKHHRRSIRLRNYDYSRPGSYFITISSAKSQKLFGDFSGNDLILSEIGRIVKETFSVIEKHFPDVEVLEYIVMPDHVHFILSSRKVICRKSGRKATIGDVIGCFKSISANNCIAYYRQINKPCPPIWHRNYYEHIIRDRKEMVEISRYIVDNPKNWGSDECHL